MTGTEANRQHDPAVLTVSHVADFCRRYPGETVTLYTRVEVPPPLPGFTLRVALPAGMILTDYLALGDQGHVLPQITVHEGANNLIWRVERETGYPGSYEYRVEARVAPTQEDLVLESRAIATFEAESGAATTVTEAASIALSAKGRYLDHLPAIYREDDLMGRFLMLFESFWAPIDHQIDDLHFYFDPRMTPPELLPWLASWISLVLDERWPVAKRRRLLRSAAALYRKRGTRQGLEEYLEIYTGQKPQIVEHRAHNFHLGLDARLGPGIALGRGNKPHTFTVVLRLPPIAAEPDDERTRQVLARRRRIEAIIEAEKPAHAGYTLRIEGERETKDGLES
jgi:phage tail-like protein